MRLHKITWKPNASGEDVSYCVRWLWDHGDLHWWETDDGSIWNGSQSVWIAVRP